MQEAYNVAGAEYYADNFKRLGEDNDDYGMSKTEICEVYPDTARIYQYTISGVVTLTPEPDNQHDPNAIRVDVDGLKIGYIKRSETSRVKEIISSGDYSVRINVGGYGKCKIVYEDMDLQKHVDTETDPSYFCQIIIDDKKEPQRVQSPAEPTTTTKEKKPKKRVRILPIIFIILGVITFPKYPASGLIVIIIGLLILFMGKRKQK